MPLLVKVKDVVDALEEAGDQLNHYLDKRTGEIVLITDEQMSAAEEGEDEEEGLDGSPDWEQEAILKAREVLETDHFLALPDQFDIHEYALMEDFCRSQPDQKRGAQLLREIKGSGAFRRFKHVIQSLGIEQDWYRFREAEFERITIEWLEENGIPYTP